MSQPVRRYPLRKLPGRPDLVTWRCACGRTAAVYLGSTPRDFKYGFKWRGSPEKATCGRCISETRGRGR